MSGTAFTWSHSQVTEADTALRRALPKALRKHNPRHLIPMLTRQGERLEKLLAEAMKSMIVVVPKGQIELDLSDVPPPGEFFKNREGIRVASQWPDFFSKVKPVKAGKKVVLNMYEQGITEWDDTIKGALPKKHVFETDIACAILTRLILRQPRGEPGIMPMNCLNTRLYLETGVLQTSWGSTPPLWFIYAGTNNINRNEAPRSEGSLILVPA